MQRIIIIQDIAMKFHMLTALVILISTSVTVANVLCSKTSTTWQQGVDNCLEDRGTPVSGKSVQLMEFKHDIHVWTSDYYVVYESLNNTQDRLCGFVYLPAESTQSEILFSDCRYNRSTLCFQFWDNHWEVDSGPWNNARECWSWKNRWMYHAPYSGYYWSSETKKGLHHHLESRHGLASSDKTVMCSAYNMEASRYFRNCEVKLKSICQFETVTTATRHFQECRTGNGDSETILTETSRIRITSSTINIIHQSTNKVDNMKKTDAKNSKERNEIMTSNSKQSTDDVPSYPFAISSQTSFPFDHLILENSTKSETTGTPESTLGIPIRVNNVTIVAVATSLLVVAVISVLIFSQRRYGCIRLRPEGRPISMTIESNASAEERSFHANQSNDINHYSSVNMTEQIATNISENGQPCKYSFAVKNSGEHTYDTLGAPDDEPVYDSVCQK